MFNQLTRLQRPLSQFCLSRNRVFTPFREPIYRQFGTARKEDEAEVIIEQN
jgi:hypothetical protein